MSAAPRFPSSIGYNGLRMTADEYLAIGETPERYELINGVVFMSPSPSFRHQRVLRHVLKQFETCADRLRGLEIAIDTDLALGEHTVYQPDIAVYAPGRLPTDAAKLEVAPDLAVEILSPSSRPLDLVTKRDDYEKFGVGEYWVIDPIPVTLRRWRREGDRLVETPVDALSVSCESVPGLALDLAKVRAAM